MRGRNRNKGHHHNPLSRVYESNGPDVKIRGNAAHVAEKYMQLARDSQSSGDPVAAENYFQHAEHYFRMIAAAQEQFRQSQPYNQQHQGGAPVVQGAADTREEDFDDVDEESMGQPMQGQSGGEQPSFGTRDPQPYLPSNAQFYPPRDNQNFGGRPQHQQHPQQQHPQQQHPQQQHPQQQHNQQNSPQQPPRDQDGNIGQLPSFITGGGQPQNFQSNQGHGQNGYDNQGDRFPMHRRRRRHRGGGGPRQDMPGSPQQGIGHQDIVHDGGPGEEPTPQAPRTDGEPGPT